MIAKNKAKKITVSLFTFFWLSIIFTFPFFVSAQVGTIVAPATDAILVQQNVKEEVDRSFMAILAVTWKNALTTFLGKLAYDAAVWISSAGSGQESLVYDKPVAEYLTDVADSTAGAAIEGFATAVGFDAAAICQPPSDLLQLHIGLGLEAQVIEPPEPKCTLTELADNWTEAFSDPNFGDYLDAYWDPGGNPLSIAWSASQIVQEETEAAKEAAEIERQISEWRPKSETVSGLIQTPGSLVESTIKRPIEESSSPLRTYTFSAMADAGSIFTNTLIAKLMERVMQGLASLSESSELAELVSGETGVATGKEAAEAAYASWLTPSLITGGTYSVIQELASCPTTYAGANNCAIGPIFQTAIEQNWTVQQFVDYLTSMGVTSFQFANDEITAGSDEGLTYRAILLLKKYRIAPVGWQLAAELIRAGWSGEKTLQNLVDEYDACGSADYSVFCGLVDPTWVLKAPESYCAKEGYTESYDYFTSNDTDSNSNTQEDITLTRKQECVDDQACLYEDDEGNCFAYGYCTKERRIYRFSGDSCNEQYATCQTFEDEDGNTYSYLKNTLNYGDCASGVGCQWLCQYPGDGSYACHDQDTVYNTCDSSDTDYYSMNEVCACTLEESCYVPAGSDFTDNTTCETSSKFTCTLSDTCSSNDATYDSYSGECLCTTSESCNVDVNDEYCTTDSYGTCYLNDEDGDDSIDSCSSTYSTYTYEETCTATASEDATTCEISLGDYSCTTDSGYTAYLGTAEEIDLGEDVSLNLDANAEECSSEDDGCHEFIRVLPETNLIFNNSFETFEGTADDTTADEFAYNTSAEGCSSGSDCYGWQNNVSAYASSSVSEEYDTYALVIPAGDGSSALTYTLETGRSLANRSFIFQYYAMSDTGCDGSYEINDQTATATYTSSWTDYSIDYTFPDSETSTAVTVSINNAACDIYIDVAALWETDTAPEEYSDYGDENVVYLNGNRSECEAEEVGCELYTPDGGGSEDAIPGIITNPNEEACADDYVSAECSQCPSEMEGCDFYTIAALENTPPAATGRGEASVSVIPSSGETCSAAGVGCEEYTNLDEVAAGGEGLEYYTYIRPCVTSVDTEVDTYYTWEGSDIAGYQLRAWTLKKGSDDGPCTELDWVSSSATASCTAAEDCDTDDTDCRTYYDASGISYLRSEDEVIWVSDDCHPLRNSLDNSVYYSIPDQSTECSASEVGCREYRGNDAGNSQEILNETFNDGTAGDWNSSVSNEALTTDDYSLTLIDGLSINLYTTDDDGTTSTDLEEETSYLLSFWAKGSGTATAYLDGNQFTETATLDSSNWEYYLLGPVYLSSLTESPALSFSGATGYIDNIILTKSTNQYLIKDTATECTGYEGCTKYTDRGDTTHYLKSFQNLCSSEAVGCEAMIDTQNSSSPFTQIWQDDNEYGADDVTIDYDQADFVVYDEDLECSEGSKGCQAFGLPDINEQTGEVESYEEVYYLNDPDDYDSILCEDQHLTCKEYTSDYDGTVYFKDPGSKTCTWEDQDGDGIYSWYETDGSDLCTAQWSADTYSPPAFPVCNSNSENVGDPCNTDDDCTTSSTASYPARCDSSSTWAGLCSENQSGCTQYLDPVASNSFTLNANSSFEDDVKDNSTGAYADEGDGLADEWDNAAINTDYYYDGLQSVLISDATLIAQDSIPIDTTEIYTLSGYFQGSPTSLSVGLKYYYYDESSESTVEITTGDNNVVADSETLSDATAWHYFWGQIGEGADIEFPASTEYVKVFVTVTGSAYVDLVGFKEQEEYFYLDYTVDGTAEFSSAGGTASCSEVNDLDCVAFHDTLESDIAYSAHDHDVVNSCEITVNSDTCRQEEDSADTNVILKVKPDRVCGEWLTCETTGVVIDDQGNEETTCYALGACDHLNQDGRCDSFVANPSYENLGTLSDLTYTSAPGDTNDLDNIQDMSGYSKAGMSWFSLLMCEGGVNEGDVCTSDEDCEDVGECVASTQTTCEGGSLDGTYCTPDDDNPSDNYDDECTDATNSGTCETENYCSGGVDESGESLDGELCTSSSDCNQGDGTCSEKCIWTCTRYSGGVETMSNVETSCDSDDVCLTPGSWAGTCESVSNNCGSARCDGGSNDGEICSDDTDCATSTGTCEEQQRCEGGTRDRASCSSNDDCLDSGRCTSAESYQCLGSSMSGEPCDGIDDTTTCVGYQDGTCSDQFTIQGYYPFSWMTEVGSYDTTSSSQDKDLIEVADKSFEDLYCIVDGEETDVPCVNDSNCATTDVESHNTSAEESTEDDIETWTEGTDYFCPDSPDTYADDWPFIAWSSYGGATDIDQYDERFGSENTELETIDLNNVLGVSGGAQYDLENKVQSDNQYVLSFEGRYNGTISGDEGMSVAFEHSAGGRDYFAKGEGMADVVFVVDSTGSMASVFSSIQSNISSFASSLTDLGIDLQLALVDMDNNTEALDLDLTSNVSAFQTAVAALDSSGAGTDVYTTLVNVLGGTLEDGNTISYRGYATKVIILVTDVIPDDYSGSSGDADSTTYDTVSAAFAGGEEILYVINDGTSTNETTLYPSLAQSTGGDYYNDLFSSSSDWSTILSAISDSIEAQIEAFALSSDWTKYVLGPITVGEKETASETTILFFEDETDFQIDNVSLMPALEINKDLDLLSRSCRAYPESDSLQCDYTESSGMRFRGWKGYCLETDPQNENKCLLWWPVDTLEGEPDFRSKTKAGYAGRTPLYYCLVSKGNYDLATCDDGGPVSEGTLCDEDADCGSGGSCSLESYEEEVHRDTHEIADSYGYKIKRTIEEIDINSMWGNFRRYNPILQEKAITLSEIERIVINQGDVQGSTEVADNLVFQWSTDDINITQLPADSTTGAVLEEFPNESGSCDETYPDLDRCWDENGGEDHTEGNAEYRQARFWQWDEDNKDLMYVYTFNRVSDESDQQAEYLDNDDSLENFFDSVVDENLWNTYEDYKEDVGILDSAWDAESDNWGGNVWAIKFDFDGNEEDPSLNHIYLILWSGFDDDNGLDGDEDTQNIQNISWTYYLREPCLAIAEVVDEEGTNQAWTTRIEDEGHTLPLLGYSFSTFEEPFGAMTPLDSTDFTEWDGLDDDDVLVTTQGSQPFLVRPGSTVISQNAGSPFSCVHSCEGQVEAGDSETGEGYGDGCAEDAEDSDGDGNTSEIICSCSEEECVGLGNDWASYNGLDDSSDITLEDQIGSAAEDGFNELERLFSDIRNIYVWNNETGAYEASSNITFDDYDNMDECDEDDRDASSSEYCGVQPTITDLSVDGQNYGSLYLSSGEAVELTFTSNVDSEQLPLRQIYIDWGDGNVTSEDWNAAPGDHSYSHYYTCTDASEGEKYYDGSGNQHNYYGTSCTALISMVLTDNWDWCSEGNAALSSADNRYNSGEDVLTDCGVYYSLPVSIHISP